jgi:hypothetical protein
VLVEFPEDVADREQVVGVAVRIEVELDQIGDCLLYTSDAADDM